MGKSRHINIPPDVIDWLLEGPAYVRYCTLTDLLGKGERTGEVVAARAAIADDRDIRRLLSRRNKSGYWGRPADIRTWWPRKDTTFWVLGMLADFGLDRRNDKIDTACEYVFSTQHPDGAFGWSDPPVPGDCFTGILVETLAGLGYGRDQRVKKAYRWLAERQRHDGGFWCKNRGLPGGPREDEPSCAMASLFVLGALAKNPELKDGDISARCLEFLLGCWEKRGRIKFAGHDSQIGTGWEKLKYPFTDYRILKYLDVASQFAAVRDKPAVGQMVDLLMSKRDENGRFIPESIHLCWSDFDFGQKKNPSRWLTFLVYRILSRLGR